MVRGAVRMKFPVRNLVDLEDGLGRIGTMGAGLVHGASGSSVFKESPRTMISGLVSRST